MPSSSPHLPPPPFAELYPAGIELLSRVDEDAKLVQALSSFPAYRAMFERFLNSSPDDFSIDDEFYKVRQPLSMLSTNVTYTFPRHTHAAP